MITQWIQRASAAPWWSYGLMAAVGVILLAIALNSQQPPVPAAKEAAAINKAALLPALPLPAVPALDAGGTASKEIAAKSTDLVGKVVQQADKLVDTTGVIIDTGADVVQFGANGINALLPRNDTDAKK